MVGAANAHAAAANGVASAPNEDARQEQSDVANAEAEHVAEAVNDLLHQLGNQKRAATAKELHDNAHVAAVMARAAEDPETQAYLANAARLGQNAADMLNAFSNDPQSIDANLGNNDDLGKVRPFVCVGGVVLFCFVLFFCFFFVLFLFCFLLL